MAKEQTPAPHPTKVIFDCPEDGRITQIENNVIAINSKMDSMVDSMDDLTHKFTDAMFPSEMHPDNGLINSAHRNKADIVEIKKTMIKYEEAQLIQNVGAIEKIINKYEDAKVLDNVEVIKLAILKGKIWIAAICGLSIILTGVFVYIIDTYMKTK